MSNEYESEAVAVAPVMGFKILEIGASDFSSAYHVELHATASRKATHKHTQMGKIQMLEYKVHLNIIQSFDKDELHLASLIVPFAIGLLCG